MDNKFVQSILKQKLSNKNNSAVLSFLYLKMSITLSFPSSNIKMEMNSNLVELRRPRSNAFDSSYPKKVELPYDIINVIFEYLSHITDSGWILNVNNYGRLTLLARPSVMMGIDYINKFKQCFRARYIRLGLTQFGYPVIVDALEQPHITCDQTKTDENCQKGFEIHAYCCTYIDPETNTKMVAYAESHHYFNFGYKFFQRGCVYGETGDTYVVQSYAPTNSSSNVDINNQYDATIQVNRLNMIWDADYSDDEYDIVTPLHMYM